MSITDSSANDSTTGGFAGEFAKFIEEKLQEIVPGNILTGTIVEVDKEMVTVDIGFKSHGLIPVPQFQDVDGKLQAVVGNEVEVMLVALENDQEQVVLSREKAVQKKVWAEVETTFEDGGTVHGVVVQKVKGGLHVDIGIPAFLPGSQIDVRPHRNLDKFIGEKFEFKILKITKEKGKSAPRRAEKHSDRDAQREHTTATL